jgi:hypothetical protein
MSSEKIPIDAKNPAARRKGTRATTVGRSCSSFMKTSVIIVRRIPVVPRPRLKIKALEKGAGPMSVRVQCPRSLNALSIQLKFGDSRIEIEIQTNAITGVITPIKDIHCKRFPLSIITMNS